MVGGRREFSVPTLVCGCIVSAGIPRAPMPRATPKHRAAGGGTREHPTSRYGWVMVKSQGDVVTELSPWRAALYMDPGGVTLSGVPVPACAVPGTAPALPRMAGTDPGWDLGTLGRRV